MKEQPSLPDIQVDSRFPSLLGGILSYLIPGLGQVYQGRIGKGIMFFVCLYGMFFYGQYLGNWQNVYVYYREAGVHDARGGRGGTVGLLTDRARFIAQAGIGIAAWPAIWQHYTYDPLEDRHPVLGRFQRPPTEDELNAMLRDSDKGPDLGWIYTVIAGVLNILVIYDAYAGPIFVPRLRSKEQTAEENQEEIRS